LFTGTKTGNFNALPPWLDFLKTLIALRRNELLAENLIA
jgi:hypothetical protein